MGKRYESREIEGIMVEWEVRPTIGDALEELREAVRPFGARLTIEREKHVRVEGLVPPCAIEQVLAEFGKRVRQARPKQPRDSEKTARALNSAFEYVPVRFSKELSAEELALVGTHHRPPEAKQLLDHKGVDTIVLLVREPGNTFDGNAVMAYAWRAACLGQSGAWVHVGYIQAEHAAALANEWPKEGEDDLAVVARIAVKPLSWDGRRGGNNIRLRVGLGGRRFHNGL